MNTQQFLNLKQTLKEGQSLQVDWQGKVKILGPRKKDFQFIGILEFFDDVIVPLKNKLWATPPIPGKQKYWKFGESLPKYDRIHSNEYKIKIRTALGIFEALKAMEIESKKSTWTDGYLKITYQVEELGKVKIYKYNDVIRYVEFEGEKMIIPQLKPDGIQFPK